MKPYSRKYYLELAKIVVRENWKGYVAGFFSALILMSCTAAYAAEPVWPDEWNPHGRGIVAYSRPGLFKNYFGEAFAITTEGYEDQSGVSYLDGRPAMIVSNAADPCSPLWIDMGIWEGETLAEANVKVRKEWSAVNWKKFPHGLCE